MKSGDVIFTVGHSTRTVADLVALLQEAKVTLLMDVRSIPRSRATPQFNGDTLPDSIAAAGIGYRHLRALGGRRHRPRGAPPSPNQYWSVEAFRSYADHSDYLVARGWVVEHILEPGQLMPATLTPGAQVVADGTVRYPATEPEEGNGA
jgi:uncharacterized protein (DUF488 family)